MRSSLALLAFGAASALAATTCGIGKLCPKDSPCCSQYGECGVGAYCLGGCDPRMSYSLDSCMPAPVCESRTMTFENLDSVMDIGKYLGDESKADWVSQGEPVAYKGDMLLTMPKDSVGTVLASTTYMWYGNVKARFKTSRGRGVVTAFILLSDVKDEIDYEFVGVDLQTAQTNFYFQAVPNYNNSGNISLTDTFDNFHDYEVRWTPDSIQWLVDGQVGRTVERKDTWNASSNQWAYPQTPARVQLSIWPGGASTNAPGTISWAGGDIEWSGPDIDGVGYYYTTFNSVSIECYNASSAPGTNKDKSYTYDNISGTNDTVVNGNDSPILGSFDATGLNPDEGKESGSGTASASGAKSTAAQVPGGSNGSPSSQDHSSGDSGNDSGSSPGGDSGGSAPEPSSTAGCGTSSFNQNCGGSGSGNGKGSAGSKASASALAIIIAGCALFWL